MVRQGEFYAGSKFFTPLADVIGLPIDQMNFLICQFLSLGLSIPFRQVLSPKKTRPIVRHTVELIIGMALTYFCFNYQIWHVILQSLVVYLLLMFGDARWSHQAVFFFSMIYLSVVHIYRQFYDYGGFTLDITGPLMINTQKLTSLAFSFHDGQVRKKEDLTTWQRKNRIEQLPSLLNFYSYIFFFHGIMCGPLCFYADYNAFITGSNIENSKPAAEENGKSESSSGVTATEDEQREKELDRSLQAAVLKKLALGMFFGVMAVVTPKLVPASFLTAEEYYEWNFLQKIIYMLLSVTLVRSRYYFAWILSEAVNNAAGLGFSGYDDKGKPTWNLLDNVDIWEVEFSTSLKTNIDGWNKRTLIWLRQVVYERVPSKYNTMAVFCCSAIWHGFYPGYYLTFGTGMLFTVAARMMRRNVRPIFLATANMKFLYDAVTFSTTRVANVYLASSFLVLEFVPMLRLYLSLYFFLHIGAVLIILYFSLFHKPRRDKAQKSS